MLNIDNLTYGYTAGSNRLATITDATANAQGFNPMGGAGYSYDLNDDRMVPIENWKWSATKALNNEGTVTNWITAKRDSDLGLNLLDYGVRWYDGSIGRWTSIDPLANKYFRHSTYNYGLNNPLRFIDKDGRKADDIMIKGSPKEQKAILDNLRKLTNDELSINERTGKVKIISKSISPSKEVGTNLIKELVKENNTTTIQKSESGNGTDPEKLSKALNNKETNAIVNVDLMRSKTLNADGTSGVDPSISLGHELKHAQDLVRGTSDRTQIALLDPDSPKPQNIQNFTQDEVNTRSFENKLRAENNLVLRAMPIPFRLE